MQVSEDQKLLREKVQHLSGDAGIQRMESALSETRSRYFGVKDDGTPVRSPMISSVTASPTPSSERSIPEEGSNHRTARPTPSSEKSIPDESSNHRTSRVVRSLFKETNTSPGESSFSAPITRSDSNLYPPSEKLRADNEVIVNEFLHDHKYSVTDGLDVPDHTQNSLEVSTCSYKCDI